MFCLCFSHYFLFPWLCPSHGFCKHAREQYEKLSTMHKNMQKLYESIGSYFAFDPHSVSVEDFFGELANFRFLFMVSNKVYGLFTCTWKVLCLRFLQIRYTGMQATTHTCSYLHTLSLADTHWVSLKWEQNLYVAHGTHFHQTLCRSWQMVKEFVNSAA